jgi:hypothetical protein
MSSKRVQDDGSTDSMWPIYIIAAGVVTIATRFITDEANETASTIKLVIGGGLIAYGTYRFVRDRKGGRNHHT